MAIRQGLKSLIYRATFSLTLLLPAFALAGTAIPQQQGPRIGSLPPLTVIHSSEATITDSMMLMGFTKGVLPPGVQAFNGFKLNSSSLPNQGPGAGFSVYQNIDLVLFESQAIKDFMEAKGMFAREPDGKESRGFIVMRYGVEDQRAADLFKMAKEQGLHSVVLVTDGPITVDGTKVKFGTHESRGQTVADDFSADITPDKLSDHGNGAFVKAMVEQQGYRLVSPVLPKEGDLVQPGDYLVTMSAAANPALDRKPIMHQKEVLMYILKDPKKPLSVDNLKMIYVMHGTGNWANRHINRNFIYSDALKSEEGLKGVYALKHALATMETFMRAGSSAKIEDIPTVGRQRVVAQDGTYWESGYTDGQFELNQRIADELNILAGDQETINRVANNEPAEIAKLLEMAQTTEVEEVVLSHFVLSNGRVVEALANLWLKKNSEGKPFAIVGGLDAKFVALRGPGLGGLVTDYDVRTPFGRKLKALGENFTKHVRLVVQLEQVPGATNIDTEGPPFERVLWHDKTTLLKLRIKGGTRFSSIFTGSYNGSGNYHNLERQDHFYIPRSSPLAQSVELSVFSTMSGQLKAEKKALPIDQAVFVIEMAKFLGQTEVDLNWDDIQRIRGLLDQLHRQTPEVRNENLAVVQKLIIRNWARKSRLTARLQVSKEDFQGRLEAMSQFFKWYAGQSFIHQGFDVQVKANEMLGVALAILENPLSAKLALRQIFWRPNLPDHALETRVFQVYQLMGLEGLFAQEFKRQNTPDLSVKFPWEGGTVFTADLLSQTLIQDVASQVRAGQLSQAAQTLSGWITANAAALGNRTTLAASPSVIHSRLVGFVRLLAWYKALPAAADYKYATVNLDEPELVIQLLRENMDLLLLKNLPLDKEEATVRYVTSLKGYRDNPGSAGSPRSGPLTDLSQKALTLLASKPSVSEIAPQKVQPLAPMGLCRRAFL